MEHEGGPSEDPFPVVKNELRNSGVSEDWTKLIETTETHLCPLACGNAERRSWIRDGWDVALSKKGEEYLHRFHGEDDVLALRLPVVRDEIRI